MGDGPFYFPRLYNWDMLKARLEDPWFGAHFIGEVEENGSYRWIDSIEGAQGIFFWCPCGFGKPQFQDPDGGRPHGVLLPFSNPRGAPVAPDSFNRQAASHTPRWAMEGTEIADLTLSPSVAIGKPECWHGYIKAGEVT